MNNLHESSLPREKIGAFIVLSFCMAYGWLIQDIAVPFVLETANFTPRSLPTFLAVVGSVLSLLILVSSSTEQTTQNSPPLQRRSILQFFAFLALISLYGLAIRPAGFVIATVIFLVSGFTLLGERRIALSLVIGLAITIFFWVLMRYGLDVYIEPLPIWLTTR